MTAHHADIAKALIEDPDRYGEFRHRFAPEFEYYRQVRNAAPQTLGTFEEFLRLHEVFFEQSRGDTIKSWVEQNLARSLKNMVLETSPRGQAYPLSTLADVQTRLEAYSRIGVDTPALGVVVDTIVEALFDSQSDQLRSGAHERLTDLLAETPRIERTGGPVDDLARLKAAQSLASGRLSGPGTSRREELELAAREYHAATESPSAPEGASACIAAANGIPPGNIEKRKLLAAAVHQDPASIEAMWELLYWSARATIERFRHRNERPTLGRLYSARLQLTVVDSYGDVVDKPETWHRRIEAYRHVADGIECSQGRYTTTRENWPAVDFEQAAQAYEAAAEAISPIDTDRQLKYRSKAYRYRAHAADDQLHAYRMHGDAIDWLLSTVESGETTNTGLAQDLLRHHHVRRLEYEIKRLFAAREFEAVVQRHLDYHTLRGTVPLITRSDTVVDVCYHLAKSIRNWRHGDPRRTQYYYQCATDTGVSQSAVSVDALVAHAFAPQIAQGRVAASAVNGLRPVNKME